MPMFHSFVLACSALAVLAVVSRPAAGQEELHPLAAQIAEQLGDHEGAFVMLVTFTVAEGQGDALVDALGIAAEETHKEKGNLAYDLHRDPQDSTKFLLFEKWRSLADLDSHLKQPYLVELGKKFDTILNEAPELAAYVPVEE
jgi:quinol monooxygenase YgiN